MTRTVAVVQALLTQSIEKMLAWLGEWTCLSG